MINLFTNKCVRVLGKASCSHNDIIHHYKLSAVSLCCFLLLSLLGFLLLGRERSIFAAVSASGQRGQEKISHHGGWVLIGMFLFERCYKLVCSQEMQVSDNPTLRRDMSDPTIICTAYKKNRFYMFSRRNPDETQQRLVACNYYHCQYALCVCVCVCVVEEMVTEMSSMKNHPRKKSWPLLKE